MNIPKELKYTKDHEWIKVEGDIVTVGITDFAAQELGDVVFIEIETEGEVIDVEEAFGSIEAVKTVSDILMPVSGEIAEINVELEDKPELVNNDCYGAGWIIKINASDISQIDNLLDHEQYIKLIG